MPGLPSGIRLIDSSDYLWRKIPLTIEEEYLSGIPYFSVKLRGKPIAESWDKMRAEKLALDRLRMYRTIQRGLMDETNGAVSVLEENYMKDRANFQQINNGEAS